MFPFFVSYGLYHNQNPVLDAQSLSSVLSYTLSHFTGSPLLLDELPPLRASSNSVILFTVMLLEHELRLGRRSFLSRALLHTKYSVSFSRRRLGCQKNRNQQKTARSRTLPKSLRTACSRWLT